MFNILVVTEEVYNEDDDRWDWYITSIVLLEAGKQAVAVGLYDPPTDRPTAPPLALVEYQNASAATLAELEAAEAAGDCAIIEVSNAG